MWTLSRTSLFLAAASLAVAACSPAAPVATAPGGGAGDGDETPVTTTAAPTVAPATTTPTTAAESTPTPAPTAGETSDNGNGDATDMGGRWVGTGCSDSGSCDWQITFTLRQIGDVISGDVVWEKGDTAGPVDNGVRGALEGDVMILVYESGPIRKVYEGPVAGDTYTGTLTIFISDAQAPGGTGSFEVEREE
jgi:hypothetical protein